MKKREKFLYLTCISLALLIEISFGYRILIEESMLQGVNSYGLHLLSALVGTWAMTELNQDFKKSSKKFIFICTFFVWICCPFGGGVLVGLFHVSYSRFLLREVDDGLLVLNHDYFNRMSKQGQQSNKAAQASTTTVLEVLSVNDNEARRNATLNLRKFDPIYSVPVLKKGIQDSDEEVRIYSLNILSDIVENFDTVIRELSEIFKQDDFEDTDPEPYLRLASAYLEQIEIGIVDDAAGIAFALSKAEQAVEEAYRIGPDRVDVHLKRMRVCIDNGTIYKAYESLWRLHELNYSENLLFPWECEIAYKLKDWDSLLQSLRKMEDYQNFSPLLGEVKNFWYQDEVEEIA